MNAHSLQIRRGSWPLLLGAVATFLLAFVWLRSRSTFLAVEADATAARQLASAHGVELAEVLALRQVLLARGDDAKWAATTAEFAAVKVTRGRAIAALLALGDAEARTHVEQALQQTQQSAELAWQRLRVRPFALPALQFVEVCDRYAARQVVRE